MHLIPLGVIALVAGVVNGMTALGFAVVMAVGLAWLVDAKSAVLLLAVVSPVVTAAQTYRFRVELNATLTLSKPLSAATLVGVPLGVIALHSVDADVVAVVLAAVTLVFVISQAIPVRPRLPVGTQTSVAIGILAGVLNGLIGVAGPLLAIYLWGANLTPPQFGFVISLLFFAMGVVRLVTLIALEGVPADILLASSVLLAPALLGQWVGFKVQTMIRVDFIRVVTLVVLAATAMTLLVRAIG